LIKNNNDDVTFPFWILLYLSLAFPELCGSHSLNYYLFGYNLLLVHSVLFLSRIRIRFSYPSIQTNLFFFPPRRKPRIIATCTPHEISAVQKLVALTHLHRLSPRSTIYTRKPFFTFFIHNIL